MRTFLLASLLLAACQPEPAGKDADPTVPDSTTPTDSGTTDSPTDSATETDTDTTPTDTDTPEPVVLSGDARVAANLYNAFSAIVTVTVDHDSDVVIEYGEKALDHATPVVAVAAGVPTEIVVLGLRAERTFTLHAVATVGESRWESDPLTYTTAPAPAAWPVCRPTFRADEAEFNRDEVVCTNGSMSDGTYMYMCVDRWGEPMLSVRTPANDSLMSMRPLRDGSWASTSFTASKVALFDATGEQTAQYTPTWFASRTRFTHEYIDSHEMYQIPSGDWEGLLAFITNSVEYLADGSYKLGNGLIVFDPVLEEVVYDYSFQGDLGDGVAMDEKMPYDRAGYGDYYEDWNHANTLLHGVEEDGREFLLISLKAQDWIFKLYPDTDELAWALGYDGDFTLVDDVDAAEPRPLPEIDWAFHQHGVVLLEHAGARSRLLMFDNGYPRQDGENYRWDLAYSRILELEVDEDTMLAGVAFEYGAPRSSSPDHLFSSTCGNTELLPDGDAILALEGEGKTMVEVGYPSGDRRWELTCDSVEWCEYRVHYAPNLYDLTWNYP